MNETPCGGFCRSQRVLEVPPCLSEGAGVAPESRQEHAMSEPGAAGVATLGARTVR
jgi:hypothetical protein